MKIKIKKKILCVVVFTFSLTLVSCQNKNKTEFISIIIQPEIEIGQSVDFYVYTKQKVSSISSDFYTINGLELTDNLQKMLNKNPNESNITDENDKLIESTFSYFNYAKATKIGKITFPILTAKYKGKEYKTKPFSINVVDKIKIDKNTVKLIWTTNKTVFASKDTVKVCLYEYSKISQTTRKHLSTKITSMKGEKNEINIDVESEDNIDNISGINNFEKSIEQKFKLVDFSLNVMEKQSMEEINNILYIKKLIIELYLTPKLIGNFDFGTSEFDYSIYKNNSDYSDKFIPNESGTYTITENGSTNLKVKSNNLTVKVE
ncbi:hypothetical protein HNQ02_003754 [Flavobacterium sp. 7E]|uniref:hypothetical protein n=1 Tax=Flavobacterium sp. 7E TaxID=2735898 RepID=UPI0015715BC1|nr:hypothetical protein [Flavobacterium sp. 7E]NRS90807.1 hypothetical protein [Flavobacterium sp. 7E]